MAEAFAVAEVIAVGRAEQAAELRDKWPESPREWRPKLHESRRPDFAAMRPADVALQYFGRKRTNAAFPSEPSRSRLDARWMKLIAERVVPLAGICP
jgi:hypothetical protein